MYQPMIDLAGEVCFKPNFWQTKRRINHLINQYLNQEQLSDRLEDLGEQLCYPQPRKWSIISWQDISLEQVIGLDLEVLLLIIQGMLATTKPTQAYTQTSRKYLEPIYPSMARLVGGIVGENGKIIELGLWEQEERQHTAALSKIYHQLTHQPPQSKLPPLHQSPDSYQPRSNPYQDLYRHGLHRVAREYTVVCLYLWLMSQTTGTLQQVVGELLQDKINHLVKLWGLGMWLYPQGTEQLIRYLLSQINTILAVSFGSGINTNSQFKPIWQRTMSSLSWQSWSILSQGELIYTLIWTLKPMWQWSGQLTPEYLHSYCATPEFFGNNDVECHQPEIMIL